jgi:predicted AlkP superfamily phosphohydrolase/phosphomutase
VDFTAKFHLASVSGIARFYLKQVAPDFKLYVSPIQINPEDPALPITDPPGWSHELWEHLGYFHTRELPEDTKAFSAGVLTGHEFLAQAQVVYDERRRALEHFLERFDRGLLFVYFSSVDQQSHMLWRYMDPAHPGHVDDAALARGIQALYRELDEAVGRALAAVDERTTLIVMSDHGFAPFYREVSLNSWLVERGYMVLKDGRKEGRDFADVDWTRTRAYAVGLNGLYINLAGREGRGIVAPADYDALADRLERELLALVDPANGAGAVSLVVRPRRDFHGERADDGPDLLVGYGWGYRSSWDSPLGAAPSGVFADNREPWSGDHAMDARLVPGTLITNRRITLERPALYDLTVAILDEFGIAPPAQMIGKDCLGP